MARRRRTQAQLGEVLGLAQSAVSRRLNGAVEWNVSELLAIAEFLGVPAEMFLRAGAA